MKSQLYFFAFLFVYLCLITNSLLANHAAGGTIMYTHLVGNQYSIKSELYRDCAGDTAPATLTVYISSVQCGIIDSVLLNHVPGSGQEISLPCPEPTTCQGGIRPGFQKWAYENTYSFPGQCSDWIIATTIAHRNALVTTIQSPSSTPLYLEARLNNLTSDNTTVQHSVDPIVVLCLNQPFTYNPGMIDADGDSLVFELIPARIDANNNVTYLGTYSGSNPISSSTGVTLNSTTGDFSINPNALETGIIVYRVLEYRNSIMIGSIMFEGNIYTKPCPNVPPFMNPPNGLFSFSVLPGPFCFHVYTDDINQDDTITMTWNNGIPNATFIVTGDQHPEGTFCWDPDSSDVRPQPYTFTVALEDNSCPNIGAQVYSFNITVTLDSAAATNFNSETFFSGNVFFDANENGYKDGGEIDMQGQKIYVSPDSIFLFSGSYGNYLFLSTDNTPQTVSIIPEPFWHVTTDSFSYTFPDDTLYHSGLDFGLAPDSIYTSLEVNVAAGMPRCNNVCSYYVTYENDGTSEADGEIRFICDANTSFFYSVPVPDLISGDTLYFNFTNFWPSQTQQIIISLHLPGAGVQINQQVSAYYDSSGFMIEADTVLKQQTVVCSFDPNDKSVTPEGLYSDHRVLSVDPLNYTIRFQNTGNDTAFTVFVQDHIDPSLDIQSLHVIGSSHPMTTTIFPDRMVEFRFTNIHLPDSNIDEPGSNGFIQYEITPLQNLSLPIVVNNEASIYFDSNAPVITNNVWNTLVSDLTVGISPIQSGDEAIFVKPNPFHHDAEVVLGKSFMNVETQCRILDVMGRILESRRVNASSIFISGEHLQSGIYFIELISSDGNKATGKFIVD